MVGRGRSKAWSLGAFGAVLVACSGQTNQHPAGAAGSSSAPGAAGKTGQNAQAGSGVTGADTAGSGGAVADAGAASTDAGGVATSGAGGQAPSAGARAGGADTTPDANDIFKVKPSPGCGQDPTLVLGTLVKQTIQTSGVKEPDCADRLSGVPKCGPWSLLREYYVGLPADYDKTKPYPLVLQGPGCGGDGTNVYSLSPTNTDVGAGVNGTVIRVGLTPPPNSIGHGTNENQGCFDDKEGDDSVDLVFYENLLDKLKTELCYDENRVFAVGNSSGAWIANELGCKYAGDTKGHALRGVLPSTGGLPTDPKYSPTCSDKPLAGFWIYENTDIGGGFNGNLFAISRAMKAAHCASTDYGAAQVAAQVADFPIGNGVPNDTCQKILGCPDTAPLVVCALSSSAHGSHDNVVNPGFAAFLSALAPR